MAAFPKAEVRRASDRRCFVGRPQCPGCPVHRGVPSVGQRHRGGQAVFRGDARPPWYPPRVNFP